MVSATSTASAVTSGEGGSAVQPFQVGFQQSELAELRRRVLVTRWPEKETITDESQAVPRVTYTDPQAAAVGAVARVPLEVLRDVIQPFPSVSTIFDSAFKALRMVIAKMPPPLQPMQAQMARL